MNMLKFLRSEFVIDVIGAIAITAIPYVINIIKNSISAGDAKEEFTA